MRYGDDANRTCLLQAVQTLIAGAKACELSLSLLSQAAVSDYLQRAAEVDSMRFAQRDAARRLERAIRLVDGLPIAERDELHIVLLEKRNQQLLATGQLQEVTSVYQKLITFTDTAVRLCGGRSGRTTAQQF